MVLAAPLDWFLDVSMSMYVLCNWSLGMDGQRTALDPQHLLFAVTRGN